MENNIFSSLGIDSAYIILILCAMSLILLIVCITNQIKIKKLERKYDYFMRGKDAESLEDTLFKVIEDIKNLKAEDRANKDSIRTINKNIRASYQKFGLVKYNAFKGMGGNLSFACALLDYTNSGFVLNSVHSREGCYLYMKQIDRGETEVLLGNEEKEALEQALN